MRLYVASSLNNCLAVAETVKLLEDNGFHITYKWHEHGRVETMEDLPDIAKKEIEGVKQADALILLMPARTGSHVELGVALCLNKPVYMVLNGHDFEEKSFYQLPCVSRYHNIRQLIETIKGTN